MTTRTKPISKAIRTPVKLSDILVSPKEGLSERELRLWFAINILPKLPV